MKFFKLGLWIAMGSLPCGLVMANHPTDLTPQGKVFDHIITIVLENTGYEDAVTNSYFKTLINRGALFTHFNAITHPSYPNYLAMVAGSTFGIHSDSQKNLTEKTIADLLEAKGLTWKSYAEDYPGHCFLGDRERTYARKHVPLLSFTSIQHDPKRCAKVVSTDQFNKDWQAHTLPHYAFFTPNMNHNGHDTNFDTAAQWLESFLEPLLADQEGMKKTLIEVTFDEAEFFDEENQIFTLFIGPMVKPGSTQNKQENPYNVLRTIEENFSLNTLDKNDKSATVIGDIWLM